MDWGWYYPWTAPEKRLSGAWCWVAVMAPEYVEARVLVPESKIQDFLAFCDEELETMPAINRIPDSANGYEVVQEIEQAASRDEPKLGLD